MDKPSRLSRSYKKCVVCNRRRIPGSNVYLTRIPLDPHRCRLWIKAIGQEDLVYLPIEKLHQLKFVCNMHFQQTDFNNSMTRLLEHAVPTLNLPPKPLQDDLFNDFPLHIGQYPKHGLLDVTQMHNENMALQLDTQALPVTRNMCLSTPSSSQHEKTGLRESSQTHSENLTLQVCQEKTKALPVACNMCLSTPSSSHLEKADTLQDITNLDSKVPMKRPVSERSEAVDSAAVSSSPDEISKQSHKRKSCETKGSTAELSSLDEISVQSYKRKRKSSKINISSNCLNAREEKLLQKLKAQKLTLKKLARSTLDLDKMDNSMLKNLVSDVAKNHKKKPRGKRWSKNTKLWALAIFKRSPKAYRYLEWAMSVPSVKTLQRLLQSVPLEPGINTHFVSKCKDMLSSLPDQNKFCALLFDEMALKKRLIYNEASDKIEGYEDHGNDERSSKIADHVLVFMVQGLRKKFKLPIAHYFVQGTISSAKLSVLIKELIKALDETGFKIVTTVCDQGPTNVGALSLLKKFSGQSPDENYFVINDGTKIYTMFDIPHLFKSIRNNFYNAGEIVWGEKTGKWCHLIEAEEKNSQFLNFPKLTKNVVQPTYKVKMRVKYAAHALSNTMSAILHMLAWKHETRAEEIAETADVIKDLDKLFDSCNGPSSPKDVKKGIRENVSSRSNHVEMWQYFLSKMEDTKFIKSDSKIQLKNVRCLNGFKTSLKSLGDIWNLLKKEGFKYMNLRQLNQDSLENLFGTIRQHGVTNKNPTCTHFTAALKTSILSGLTAPHSRGSNCEADANTFFLNINNDQHDDILNEDSTTSTAVAAESSENLPVLSLPEEQNEDLHLQDLCTFENQPVVYVSGYLASRLLHGQDCIDCKRSLINENPNDDLYNYIGLREWWKDRKSLTYPSVGLCETVNQAKTIFENKESLHENGVSVMCMLEFNIHCNFKWFTCKNHPDLIEVLLKKLTFLFIRKHCKLMNQKFINLENTSKDNYKKAQIQSKA